MPIRMTPEIIARARKVYEGSQNILTPEEGLLKISTLMAQDSGRKPEEVIADIMNARNYNAQAVDAALSLGHKDSVKGEISLAKAKFSAASNPLDVAAYATVGIFANPIQFGKGLIFNTLEGFNRLQQGFWSLLIPEERENFWKRVAPEYMVDENTGKSSFQDIMEQTRRKRKGIEPWTTDYHKFESVPVVPDIESTDLLATLVEPDDAIRREDLKERLKAAKDTPDMTDPKKWALKAYSMAAYLFISPDVIVGGPAIKVLVKGILAAKVAKVGKIVKTMASATPKGEAAATELRKIAFTRLKEPENQAAEGVLRYLTGNDRTIIEGFKAGEYIPDIRALQLHALRGGDIVSDASGFLPTVHPAFESGVLQVRKDFQTWKDVALEHYAQAAGVAKKLGVPKHDIAKTVVPVAKASRRYGPTAGFLLSQDIWANGLKSPLLDLMAKDIGPVGALLREMSHVIPGVHGIFSRAVTTSLREQAKDTVAFKKLFNDAGITVGSDADKSIFSYLNQPRMMIWQDDALKEFLVGPEREAAFAAMSPALRTVAKAVESYYDNAATQLIKGGHINKPMEGGKLPGMVQAYAPFVFPSKDFTHGIPNAYMGFTVNTNPAFAHLKKRLFPMEASKPMPTTILGLQAYMTGYYRRIHLGSAAKEVKYITKAMPPMAARAAEVYTNAVMGAPSLMEKVMQPFFTFIRQGAGTGRVGKAIDTATELSTSITTFFYYGLLGGNLSFAVKNLFQGLNTAARESSWDMFRGMGWLITKEGQGLIKETGLNTTYKLLGDLGVGPTQHPLIKTKRGLESVIKNKVPVHAFTEQSKTEAVLLKLDDALGTAASFSESFNRGVAMLTGVSKYARKHGIKDLKALEANGAHMRAALNYGAHIAEETQFVYGVLGRNPFVPQYVGGLVGRALGQFQSFWLKQGEFIVGGMHKDMGIGLKFMLYSGMASRVLSEELGIEGSSFLGLGQTVPPFVGGESVSKGSVSPASQFLINMFALMTTRDPVESKRRGEELVEIGKALIPTYLGSTKLYRGFKDGGIWETGEVRYGGKLSHRVQGVEKFTAAIGLQTPTGAAKNRVLDRQRRFQNAEQSSIDTIQEKMYMAFEDQDFAKMGEIWKLLEQEGYKSEMPDNMLDTMNEFNSVTAVVRAFNRDKKSAVRSGALEEARRSGLLGR